MSATSSDELPGVPRRAASGAGETPGRDSRGLVIGLVVAVAVLLAALIFEVLRPWGSGGEAAGSATAQDVARSAAASPATSATAVQQDEFQKAEAALAAQRGWTAGQDYIPSQAQAVRQMIAALPAYDGAGLTMGPDDAPVEVRLFGDFSCPVCAQLHKASGQSLERLAHDGTINLEWVNFVIFNADYSSSIPAIGSVAAGQQGKGWEFIDAAYTSIPEGEHPVWTQDMVVSIAKSAGVPDIAAFTAALSDSETAQVAQDQTAMAVNNVGLNGTPALLINGAYMGGLYPTQTVTNTIDLQKELAAQGYDWTA